MIFFFFFFFADCTSPAIAVGIIFSIIDLVLIDKKWDETPGQERARAACGSRVECPIPSLAHGATANGPGLI